MPRIPLSPRVAFAAFIAAIFVWVVLDAMFGFGQRSSRAALFPLVIGVPALGLSLMAMAGELRVTREQRALRAGGPAEPATPGGISERVANRRTLVILAWIVGFYAGIWMFGYMLTGPLATFLYIRVAGKEGWRLAVGGGAISWVFFNGIFQRCLKLPLEERLGGAIIDRLEELLGFDLNQFFLVPFLEHVGC